MMTAKLFLNTSGQPIDLRPGQVDQLASKILEIFNLACDLEELDAAEDLLKTAEAILSRHGLPALKHWGQTTQSLVDAHYRLWEMRYLVR